jgi:CubicO group peptidase (beta-lactamase class C family)
MHHSASLIALTIVAIGMLAGCSVNEDSPTDALEPRIEGFVRSAMARYEAPGLTLAVVRDGEVVYTGAFGVRNLETGEPMTPECLFHSRSPSPSSPPPWCSSPSRASWTSTRR